MSLIIAYKLIFINYYIFTSVHFFINRLCGARSNAILAVKKAQLLKWPIMIQQQLKMLFYKSKGQHRNKKGWFPFMWADVDP